MSDAGVLQHTRIALNNLYISSVNNGKVQLKIDENNKNRDVKDNYW